MFSLLISEVLGEVLKCNGGTPGGPRPGVPRSRGSSAPSGLLAAVMIDVLDHGLVGLTSHVLQPAFGRNGV